MLNKIQAAFLEKGTRVIEALFGFFFREYSARKVALFRIVFGIVALLSELLVASRLIPLYSDQGYFSSSLIRANTFPWAISLLYHFDSTPDVVFLYSLLILSTVAFILGIRARIMAFIMFVLLLSFEQRTTFIVYGGDRVLRILCFYAMFLQSDQALVPAWIRKTRKMVSTVPGWPVRLIELQIAMIYLFTALLKVSGSSQWVNGSFLYSLLNNPNYSLIDGHWLTAVPILTELMTYFIMGCELSFAFLVWFKETRPWVLWLVIIMHIGIILLTNVLYFSEAMIAGLILFMDDTWIDRILNLAKRLGDRVSSSLNQLHVKHQFKGGRS